MPSRAKGVSECSITHGQKPPKHFPKVKRLPMIMFSYCTNRLSFQGVVNSVFPLSTYQYMSIAYAICAPLCGYSLGSSYVCPYKKWANSWWCGCKRRAVFANKMWESETTYILAQLEGSFLKRSSFAVRVTALHPVVNVSAAAGIIVQPHDAVMSQHGTNMKTG